MLRRTRRIVLGVFVGGSVVMAGWLMVAPSEQVTGIVALWLAAALLAAVMLVVRRVLTHPVVTIQTIFGVVSAYLLLGFVFAELYVATARLGPTPFFAGGAPTDQAAVQYFSFATLTTLGHGDLTALHDPGRSVAVLEALIGQVFMATLVARLVSSFGPARGTGNSSDASDEGDGATG